jgi:hypothetical protein
MKYHNQFIASIIKFLVDVLLFLTNGIIHLALAYGKKRYCITAPTDNKPSYLA